MRFWMLTFALVLLAPAAFSAQPVDSPQQEGRVEAREHDRVEINKAGASGVAWSKEIEREGSEFLRLHFNSIRDNTTSDYEIVFLDFKKDVALRYTKHEFSSAASFWTGLIVGDIVLVQVVGLTKAPVGLSFEIDKIARSTDAPIPESITHPNRIKDIHKGSSKLQALAKSVAKLSFIKNDKTYTCTGFMVSDDLLMTNQHCVASQRTCRTTTVVFNYQRRASNPRRIARGEQEKCTKYVTSNHNLDFSLLEISGSPGREQKWGHLPLCSRLVDPDEDLAIIQHPGGRPKKFSEDGCEVKGQSVEGRCLELETDFGHLCDTTGGSSGSPIVDKDGFVVGLHHLGFAKGQFADKNRGVKLGPILNAARAHLEEACVSTGTPAAGGSVAPVSGGKSLAHRECKSTPESTQRSEEDQP